MGETWSGSFNPPSTGEPNRKYHHAPLVDTLAGGPKLLIAPRTAQSHPEPLVVSAFLAYKAREWHMCAIEGRVRRSSPCEKAQVSPPVSTEGLA